MYNFKDAELNKHVFRTTAEGVRQIKVNLTRHTHTFYTAEAWVDAPRLPDPASNGDLEALLENVNCQALFEDAEFSPVDTDKEGNAVPDFVDDTIMEVYINESGEEEELLGLWDSD
jgi:hypothetical protein